MEQDFYKVLVIEDNPDTLELNKTILERDGHTVFTATNAGETLSLLDTACPEGKACFDETCLSGKCFDAVLIDYDLPDITGGTLGGWIRNKFPDIAIIIITGYGRLPAIVKQASHIKATLLTKPVIPEEILAALEATVEKRKYERKMKPEVNVSTKGIKHILKLGSPALHKETTH